MPTRDYLTVEEFNIYVNNIFVEEELLHNVSIVGEVSGCSVVAGHCYFTLKDKKAQVQVNCFNCERTYVPSNGDAVRITGRADYYIKGGKFAVNAYLIQPFGKGNLHLQFEKLKEKLSEEGIFSSEHKRPVPLYPKKVALVTSTKGAALQDILSTVFKKNQKQELTVVDVRVQGEYAASDVIKALTGLDKQGYDVIVVARGGGSFEDLFVFSDEKLVRTVYEMTTPVISAVGHETDYTLLDFVSDERCITPTAAAERIAFDVKGEYDAIKNALSELNSLMKDVFDDEKREITGLMSALSGSQKTLVATERLKIITNIQHIKSNIEGKIASEESQVLHSLRLIDTLSPAKRLAGGYFKILLKKKEVQSVSSLNVGDTVTVIGGDGEAHASITDTKLYGGTDDLRG